MPLRNQMARASIPEMHMKYSHGLKVSLEDTVYSAAHRGTDSELPVRSPSVFHTVTLKNLLQMKVHIKSFLSKSGLPCWEHTQSLGVQHRMYILGLIAPNNRLGQWKAFSDGKCVRTSVTFPYAWF